MAKYSSKKIKNRRRKSSSKRTYVGKSFYQYLWGLSGKHAERMYRYTERRAVQIGRDISPSEKQKVIRENTRSIYHNAKKNLKEMRYLVHEYDTDKDY